MGESDGILDKVREKVAAQSAPSSGKRDGKPAKRRQHVGVLAVRGIESQLQGEFDGSKEALRSTRADRKVDV